MNSHLDEAKIAMNQYFPLDQETHIKYLGNKKPVKMFADAMTNRQVHFGDRPDMLLINDNIAYLIEHFEFDSYSNTSKGSEIRMEQNRIEKTFSQSMPSEEGTYVHGMMQGHASYDNYIQNVEKAFIKHYRKIDVYKQNAQASGLLGKNMKMKMVFLIVDTSPVPNTVFDPIRKTQIHVSLVCSNEFMTLFETHDKLDAVIFCSTFNNEKIVYYIDRNEIPFYKTKKIDYKNMKFISFNSIHVSGFNILEPFHKKTEDM